MGFFSFRIINQNGTCEYTMNCGGVPKILHSENNKVFLLIERNKFFILDTLVIKIISFRNIQFNYFLISLQPLFLLL